MQDTSLQLKTFDRALLFSVGERSCRELKEHIRGERDLTAAEIEARKGFVREASRESFYFFAKVVLGYDKLTNQTHKRWAQELQEKFLTLSYFMRLKPRGTYKTTLYGCAFLLWVWAVYSPQIRFFYTSANQSLLDEVSAEIDRHLSPDSLFATVFGITRDPSALKNTADVFNIVGRGATKGSSLMFRTAGGSTNGVHPHVIVVDDPMDKDDRESEAVRLRKTRWFDTLLPLLVPFEMTAADGSIVEIKKTIFIATRWHLQDLVAHVLGKFGDEWDVESEGVYAKDGTPRYPELLPEPKIDSIRRKLDSVYFSCQYLNDPLPEGTRIFDESGMHFIRPDQFDVKQGTNYCFFDPSQGKSGGDYPAVVWLNVFNGRRIFFDAVDTRMGLTALISLIAAKNREHRVKLMVFETNGAMTMEQTLVSAHKEARYSIGIQPIHETRNKQERITAVQPDLYNGSWLFLSDWAERFKELRNQVLFYPAWGHDDFPDVIEKAISWVTVNMPGTFLDNASVKVAKTGTFAGSIKKRVA
jgi:predicted phage terminase large subunit-like protein